jgi:peptide/nickel transport system substrate-binding protein
MVLPKHLFGPYAGASRDAPNNLAGRHRPVHVRRFQAGRHRPRRAQQEHHMPNRPYFDTIEMKGGGVATSAARAVLQTGEYDYA